MTISNHQQVLAYSTVVELTGHLIDSLTLARVMDLIQAQGGQYQINDLTIGNTKQAVSKLITTVYAETPEKLEALLDELSPYGIKNLSQQASFLGKSDEKQSIFRFRLPKAVLIGQNWVPLVANTSGNLDNGQWVIAIEANQSKGRLCPIETVQSDESIVHGYPALKWH